MFCQGAGVTEGFFAESTSKYHNHINLSIKLWLTCKVCLRCEFSCAWWRCWTGRTCDYKCCSGMVSLRCVFCSARSSLLLVRMTCCTEYTFSWKKLNISNYFHWSLAVPVGSLSAVGSQMSFKSGRSGVSLATNATNIFTIRWWVWRWWRWEGGGAAWTQERQSRAVIVSWEQELLIIELLHRRLGSQSELGWWVKQRQTARVERLLLLDAESGGWALIIILSHCSAGLGEPASRPSLVTSVTNIITSIWWENKNM